MPRIAKQFKMARWRRDVWLDTLYCGKRLTFFRHCFRVSFVHLGIKWEPKSVAATHRAVKARRGVAPLT